MVDSGIVGQMSYFVKQRTAELSGTVARDARALARLRGRPCRVVSTVTRRAVHLAKLRPVDLAIALAVTTGACSPDAGTSPSTSAIAAPALVVGSLDRRYTVQLRAFPTDPVVPPNPIYGWGHIQLRLGATLSDSCFPNDPISPAPGSTLLTVCGRIFQRRRGAVSRWRDDRCNGLHQRDGTTAVESSSIAESSAASTSVVDDASNESSDPADESGFSTAASRAFETSADGSSCTSHARHDWAPCSSVVAMSRKRLSAFLTPLRDGRGPSLHRGWAASPLL